MLGKNGLLLPLCVCAMLAVCAAPASAIVYDFDRISSQPTGEWAIHGRDNWTETAPIYKLMAYTWLYHHWGVPAGPCTNRVLTEVDGGTGVHHAQRPNNGGWTYNLSAVTKFAMQTELQMDYHPDPVYRGFGGFGIGSAAKEWYFQFGVGIPSTHTTYHAYTQSNVAGPKSYYDFPWGLVELDVVDLRLEVDPQDNWNADLGAYEGRGRVYAMKRGTSTSWQLLNDNVNLKLATMNVNLANADRLNVWLQTALVGQDSMQVAIPTAGPITAKVFLDKDLDGVYDPTNDFDHLLPNLDMRIAGPCACGDSGESPWDGTTDGSAEFSVSQTRAGAATGFDKLDDGTYKVTDREPVYVSTDPNEGSVTPGGGTVTVWYGVRPEWGDANIDGIIDGQDFTIMKANFGGSGKLWTDGNFNTDGIVDGQDFTILKAYFGQTHPDYTGSAGAGVPEPATLLLLACGAAAALLRRRRSR